MLLLVDLSCLVWDGLYVTPTAPWMHACKRVVALLRHTGATHAACAGDLPWPTWRHDLARGAYKANRHEYKPGQRRDRGRVLAAMGVAQDVLEDVLGLTTWNAKGYEADDVIATLVERWGVEVRIASRDKDFCQLVRPHVHVVDPKTLGLTGPEEVVARWGVVPAKFTALQALIGDKADGYTGAKGVGPVTAAQLLNQHKSLQRVVDLAVHLTAGAAEAVMTMRTPDEGRYHTRSERRYAERYKRNTKPKPWVRAVAQAREQVLLAHQLATLRTDVPGLPTDLEALRVQPVPAGVLE